MDDVCYSVQSSEVMNLNCTEKQTYKTPTTVIISIETGSDVP